MGEISKLQAPECRLDYRHRAPVKHVVSSRVVYAYLANTRHCPNVVLLLGRCQRRWPYIKMLFYCWANVEDDGPTLKQHWVNASCLLGMYIGMHGCAVILHAIT